MKLYCYASLFREVYIVAKNKLHAKEIFNISDYESISIDKVLDENILNKYNLEKVGVVDIINGPTSLYE